MHRKIEAVVKSDEALEGGGFLVHRPFPTERLDHFDPFLLLDRMGPASVRPGEAKGAPDHPHRGFETVTYMLEGESEHKDSHGHHGVIRSGDVQWMTAGAGVIHSEMPSQQFQRTGGRMDGFQLWVNLPRRDKMMKPRYQELPADSIPTAQGDGFTVRVIAGESHGASAVIDTRTPILYLHVKLDANASFEQRLPEDFNAFAYVIRGKVIVDGRTIANDHAILFQREGEDAVLRAGDEPAEFLLIGGRPLEEPIARYGPFVMNTQSEIIQAIRDFQSGRFGEIN